MNDTNIGREDEETRKAPHPSDVHEWWMRHLRMTWPEGVPACELEAGEKPSGIEPWPDTWRDPEGHWTCRYLGPRSV